MRRNLLPEFNQVQPVVQAMQNLAVNNDNQVQDMEEDLAQRLPQEDNDDNMDIDDREDDQPVR